MKKFKYVIVTPENNHGGVVVLHALCDYLTQMGESAKVFNPYSFSNESRIKYMLYFAWRKTADMVSKIKNKTGRCAACNGDNAVYPNCKRKYFPFVGKNTIVIYPEIVTGNLFRSKNVVRWLLYHNRLYKIDGNKTVGYQQSDVFYCYRDVFNDKNLNPKERTLHITYFNLDLFKRTNFGERKGTCYILRKGSGRSDLPKSFDGPIVDHLPEKEKVKIFNQCERCICYDTQTAYSQIAAMCGCISIVVPEEGKTRSDYRSQSGSIFDTGYGEAFDFTDEEIAYSLETGKELLRHYKQAQILSLENVKKFVAECKILFG